MDLSSNASDQQILFELRRLLAKLAEPMEKPLPRRTAHKFPALTASQYFSTPSGVREAVRASWWRFYTLFLQTYLDYEGSGWTQAAGRDMLLHVCIVRQLFLDWDMRAQVVFRPVEALLARHRWVSFNVFLQAVDRVVAIKPAQQLSALFRRSKGRSARRQQLLFFGRVVLHSQACLTRADVWEVLELAALRPLSRQELAAQLTLICEEEEELSFQEFAQRLTQCGVA